MTELTQKEHAGLRRQREIFIAGSSGKTPRIPTNFQQLEAAARLKMSKSAFAYVAGGAGSESTIAHNTQAFEDWKIRPRMLQNVAQCDTSLELLGQKMESPILLAPIGVLDLAHRQADLAVARAASRQQHTMILSNQASRPMEEVCAALGTQNRWFQLYWSKSNTLVESLVQRAEACDCSAIVVTLDTTFLGWRSRDLDLGYLPFLQGRGIAQYTSDPVFRELMQQPAEENPNAPKRSIGWKTFSNLFQLLRNHPGNFFKNLQSGEAIRAVQTFIRIYSRPSLHWEDLAFLRERTKLPILLKGILHPEDAKKALDHGVNGLIVSNHGGRQLDGSVAAIQVLPEVVEAVQGAIPVLLDSGIRNGSHVFKALALGATAVCLGRPYVYGLALAGEKGVQEVLKNIQADFELAMSLAGCRNLEEVSNVTLIPHKS